MDSSDQQAEVEASIKKNYKKLKAGFEQLEKLDDAKKPALLKELTTIMQDCKRCDICAPLMLLRVGLVLPPPTTSGCKAICSSRPFSLLRLYRGHLVKLNRCAGR